MRRLTIAGWRSSITAGLLTLALTAGCQPPSAVPAGAAVTVDAQPPARPAGPASVAAPVLPPFPDPPADDLDGGQLIEETWDSYAMQGSRIGYARTTTAKVSEQGRDLIRTAHYMHTQMQRGGQSVTQDLLLKCWDTAAGELVRFESRMSAGPGEVVAVGAVRGKMLGIDVTTLGRTESSQQPWQPTWGGLFAPEQSLRRAPLRPGQSCTVRSLLPIFNIPGDTQLQARDVEQLTVPDPQHATAATGQTTRTTQLIRISSTLHVGQQRIESFLWTDEFGQVMKSLVPGIGQEAVRTTKADALRRSPGAPYDLLAASTVPVTGSLPDPPRTKRVLYRATLSEGSIAGLFAEGLSQKVEPQQVEAQHARSALITVIAVRPDEPPRVDVPSSPPTAADATSNNYIQSDDSQVKALATRIAPGESDPWKLACALEKFVDETIQLKSFSQAFATAAEVCRSLEGDCTEHAVLLAALCRARQIPARVAFGLVYYPPENGFAYHMWNEVWIKDRWIPLDATLGLGGIGADHLKLGDSNLAGGSPLADLLAVIQAFGRLRLEVVEAE